MKHTSPLRTGALVLAGALALAACGSSGGSDASSTTERTTTSVAKTTTTAEATTTTAATTSTTAAPSGEQPATAIWPFASSDQRFDDPVAAAQSFAADYLGFVDPVMGPFQQGDTRSGEVEVKPIGNGPTSTVLVRQVTDDDTWWVIGASTANLQLTSPEALATIGAPVTLEGQSTAFEATVNVEIRQDGTTEPLVEDFVMGGSMGELGPFSKEISFESPNEGGGAIILKTLSAEDGRVWEASAVRISFAG